MSKLYADDICYILEVTNDIHAFLSFLHKNMRGELFYETNVDSVENYCCLRFRPENKYYIGEMKEFIFKDAIVSIEGIPITVIDFYETENTIHSEDDDSITESDDE
jgi:hypothetical protein